MAKKKRLSYELVTPSSGDVVRLPRVKKVEVPEVLKVRVSGCEAKDAFSVEGLRERSQQGKVTGGSYRRSR